MFEVIQLGDMKTVSAKSACNHVYVVDVSGSMYHDLPKIRQHLKNIISVVAQPQDTFSVIYFSGRGQCGVVFENVLVSDASTVQMMHSSIDRYIQCIGLTGFIDPIDKAMSLNLDPNKINNFIMLTDGYDNQSARKSILEKAETLSQKFGSVSFIEYGYYADRQLLNEMAQAANGVHIFADGIVNYERVIEEAVSSVTRVANVDVKVNQRAKHCIYMYNDTIRIVPVVDGVAQVPEDVDKVHSIVPSDVLNKQLSEEHLYMILYYASKQSNDKLVWDCLQALGDVNLVELYQNAFTKQELSEFEQTVQTCVLDSSTRFVKGKDLNCVPKKNAPTVIDLLEAIAQSENSVLVMNSPYWNYKRTGRGSSAVNELPRFVPSPVSNVSLKGLVFSSERPNVSISTNVKGQVELPENDFGLNMVPSFITRNYTIIKDGIRNVDKLPVMIGKTDFEVRQLAEFPHEVVEVVDNKLYVVFDLQRIPVVNRSMVENIELEDFTQVVAKTESLKAQLKVLSHLIKQEGTTAKIEGLIDAYGEEAAKWLSSIGVRDYGFSAVGTKSDDATDEYESIQVQYKIKGLSSLPSIKAVTDKVAGNKKLNLGDTLINSALEQFDGVEHSELELKKEIMTSQKRKGEAELAAQVYALVLGRKWFSDDEVVETQIDIDGNVAQMTVEKVRKMIKV